MAHGACWNTADGSAPRCEHLEGRAPDVPAVADVRAMQGGRADVDCPPAVPDLRMGRLL